MATKQLMFVETTEPSNQATVEKLHAEAVVLHSNESIRLSTSTAGVPVLDVYGHVLADKVRGRSDSRLKSDIKDLENSLSLIKQLVGKTYTQGNVQSFGLIAQDVRKVVPEVVSEDDRGFLNVSYIELIPFLIEAVKSLDNKIAYLSSK